MTLEELNYQKAINAYKHTQLGFNTLLFILTVVCVLSYYYIPIILWICVPILCFLGVACLHFLLTSYPNKNEFFSHKKEKPKVICNLSLHQFYEGL